MKTSNLLAVILAAALGASACAKAEADTTESSAVTASGSETAVSDISVTGCLRSDQPGSFIINRINGVSRRAVGTSGSATAGDSHTSDAAAAAYRVGPSNSEVLGSVVGQWVNVSGTLREQPTDNISRIDAIVVSVLGATCGDQAETQKTSSKKSRS